MNSDLSQIFQIQHNIPYLPQDLWNLIWIRVIRDCHYTQERFITQRLSSLSLVCRSSYNLISPYLHALRKLQVFYL